MSRKTARFGDLAQTPKPEPHEKDVDAKSNLPSSGDIDLSIPTTPKKVQRSRVGRRAMTFYINEQLSKTIRIVGVETDRSLEDIATEAFNDFLRKNGRHPIV